VATPLDDPGVTRSHSRPKVTNDNPFSEARFKTAKYSPVFPEYFADLAAAQSFMSDFVDWYNHCHSGIGLHTPGRRPLQPSPNAAVRSVDQARAAHPERFTTSPALPKTLLLPEPVWINQPEQQAGTPAA
jgi:putative transposase